MRVRSGRQYHAGVAKVEKPMVRFATILAALVAKAKTNNNKKRPIS